MVKSKTNKQKDERDFEIGALIFCIIAVGIIALFHYDIINLPEVHNPYDEACKEIGYNKSTDHDNDYCRGGTQSVSVECDNTIIEHYTIVKECVEYDKWGDCNSKRTKLKLANYSC